MNGHIGTTGALITVNPNSGRIDDIFIIAPDDQAGAVIAGTLARITKPYHWGWIWRLIGKRRFQFRMKGG